MSRRIDQIAKAVVADTCAVWNILSSTVLHRACVSVGFEFAMTEFVLYECLHKPRKRARDADVKLKDRLRAARAGQQFRSYSLSVEDLQEVAILESRKRLAKGELASIAFAKRVSLTFQTDDQSARSVASAALTAQRVQTTPHVVGWLFYEGRLSDGDLKGLLEEHESFERPLRPYIVEMYNEAMRCRLLRQTSDGNAS